jgi:type IV pilus assembly protein PilA
MKIKTTITPIASPRYVISRGQWAATSPLDAARNTQHDSRQSQIANRKSKMGFTLIELLVVIAIIVIIAALLTPVFGIVVKKSLIQRAQSERDMLEAAIERYHAKFGYYPPSSALGTSPTNGVLNQLYFELAGTTTNSTGFTTLDNSSTISASAMTSLFNVGGFMNSTKGSGDDAVVAQNFLPALKPAEIGARTNGDGTVTYIIITGVHSDSFYQPPSPGFTSLAGGPANPWRYVYPGINNPSSYDLWVQIYVGGKTNLISNWSTAPKINFPMP